MNHYPTTSDSKTNEGGGIGAFTSNLTGLRRGTIYYVRAYATNSAGTAYGEEKVLITANREGSFEYEGRTYRYISIGNQTWMAENLAWLPSVSPGNAGSETEKHYYVSGYQGTDLNLAKATDNYAIYGVLYNWPAALDACPPDWHLPSKEEIQTMLDVVGEYGAVQLRDASGL